MTDWLQRLAGALGLDPPSAETIATLLDLAGTAAHASDRRAAPVTCWLIGAARVPPDEARAIVDRLARGDDRDR